MSNPIKLKDLNCINFKHERDPNSRENSDNENQRCLILSPQSEDYSDRGERNICIHVRT